MPLLSQWIKKSKSEDLEFFVIRVRKRTGLKTEDFFKLKIYGANKAKYNHLPTQHLTT